MNPAHPATRTIPPRALQHPGAPSAERWRSTVAAGKRRKLVLRAGLSVNEAIALALAEVGFDGGFLRLDEVALAPLRYVIPAASDGAHAAWYSATFAPEGTALIEEAGAIAGWHDGERFVHCHGIWRLADGSRRMGHLLPHESVLERDATVEAYGLIGATFDAEEDSETGFKLFAPRPTNSAQHQGGKTLVCTVRPNEDICSAIETICREHGIGRAAVHGIGSLVGADFEDGTHVASYATEVLVRRGEVTPNRPRCSLDIVMVGMDGEINAGLLVRDRNTVCITFELLIEELPDGN